MSKSNLSHALILLLSFIFYSVSGAKIPSQKNPGPVVELNYGSFQGNATGNLVAFLGMPFAAPPIGRLRFEPPQPPKRFSSVRQALSFGAACPQLEFVFPQIPSPGPNLSSSLVGPTVTSEDCLFVNVIKPANIPHGKKLPVLFWIYGGGFELGDTSLNPGNSVVERSIALNEPVIYVSANYRLAAFGFLGGKEVKEAGIGNTGIRDQRFALQWVQEHIESFGGDPKRVTIWGESAGAISVGLHLLLNNGNTEGLFHGAFMESGSPLPLRDTVSYQPFYDQLVTDTGCSKSKNTLECLRTVPFDNFVAAMNKSPSIFNSTSLTLVWQPSIDGRLIVRDPQASIQQGLYAKVPFVTGDCDDEGTLFSFTTLNITTNQQFLDYIESNYFQNKVGPDQLAAVGAAYPDDVTQGSPFDTGTANALTPQYKRLAAFQGDIFFQAPRRFFLQHASKTQSTFAFLFKRGKATPFLGSFHSSDIPEFYATDPTSGFAGADALINFVNTQNPTQPTNPMSLLSKVDWKPWGASADAPPLLTFLDPAPAIAINTDTFRADAMKLLTTISLQNANT